MKIRNPLPPSETTEILALIEVLDEASRRLELLTGGEVDTVASRKGRTHTLYRSQNALRQSDAAKQTAILNALPAHVALLDRNGVIVAANKGWRTFAAANSFHGVACCVGMDYPMVCDSASGPHSADARAAGRGIRSVLSGEAKMYSMEYPCHSPTAQRWFLLRITPLMTEGRGGVVVMHLDITAEREARERMHVSESRFRQMAETIRDVFFLRNVEGTEIYYVSPAYAALWGRSCQTLYADPKSWAESIHPDDRAKWLEAVNDGGLKGFDCEHRIVREDGAIRWVHSRGFPILTDTGKPYRIAGVVSDVTSRKIAEIRVDHLNRVYAMLSRVNSLIVRERDKIEMFREACRIAVEAGAFRMAWIGVIDPSTLEGRVVAWCGGAAKYVEKIRLTAQLGTPDSERPASRVARTSKRVLINEIASDTSLLLKEELLEQGHKSAVYFPFIVAGRCEAVFGLFAGEMDAFDSEELALLQQLCDDISFALDNLDKSEKLAYIGFYDPVTGLANRRLFLERVAQYIDGIGDPDNRIAVCLMDIERFKAINDTFGRAAGDDLLKQTAQWLAGSVGNASLLARIGADLFAIVLPRFKNDEDISRFLEHAVSEYLQHPFKLNNADFRIAAKLGIAVFPGDGATADSLFAHAEAALKKAKVGGDRFLFYAQQMTQTVAGRLNMEFRLRQAIAKQEFVLHYQPKFHSQGGYLTGAEALIRWHDPSAGLIPPGRFIPLLEETGLIFEVGRWALHKAVEDHLHWRDAGFAGIRLAVNVSALQLRNRGFVADIERAIAGDPRAADGLELEITESLVMADVGLSIDILKSVRGLGICVAIDDFGTGYSSLGYLSKLPIDSLKIDRSFITEIEASPDGQALVNGIINLGHAMKLKIIAEGVELPEQAALLRNFQCDEMQGFLFGRPVPRDVFENTHLRRPTLQS
jgi:diguanylate cyclase (GGDEF)-like protein/PAS domain S-box-containing protein